jgi:hypothetical protein
LPTAKPFLPPKIRKIGNRKKCKKKRCVIRGNAALYGAKSKSYSAARSPSPLRPQKDRPKFDFVATLHPFIIFPFENPAIY